MIHPPDEFSHVLLFYSSAVQTAKRQHGSTFINRFLDQSVFNQEAHRGLTGSRGG